MLSYKLEPDDSPESPREWDNLGTFITWQSNYCSPDTNNYADADAMYLDLCLEAGVDLEDKYNESDVLQTRFDYLEDFINDVCQEIIEHHYVMLPVYKFEHSGIAYSTSPFSCPWDSGQVGFIYVSKKDIVKEYDKCGAEEIEKAETLLKGAVETYSQYADGDVWGYVIEDELGKTVDSCWGLYGYEYCEEEAKFMLKISQEYEQAPKRRAEKIFSAIIPMYDDKETVIRDCLADLMHYCRINEIDFDAECESALVCFQDEVMEETSK